jgi:hypothetical protein
VLGLTFKEDCPDLRNSRVIDVIRELESYGVEVLVHDPVADEGGSSTSTAYRCMRGRICPGWMPSLQRFRTGVRRAATQRLRGMLKQGGVLADIKCSSMLPRCARRACRSGACEVRVTHPSALPAALVERNLRLRVAAGW